MFNEATLLGYVGKDPSIRWTKDKREVVILNLSTHEVWKDKTSGERKEKTEWHRVIIYQTRLIDLIKNYVKKGSKLFIRGKISTRSWENNGQKNYTTEIVVDNEGRITLLDNKETNPTKFHNETDNDREINNNLEESNSQNIENKSQEDFSEDLNDDDIPF